MAIQFPSGFQLVCTEPIDNRLVLTKAQMLAMKKAKMPSVYFAVCVDDGQLYIYNSTNDVDPETGRFRLVQQNSTTINNLEDIISKDEDNILFKVEDGLKVTESASIDSDTIQNLFKEVIDGYDDQGIFGSKWSDII